MKRISRIEDSSGLCVWVLEGIDSLDLPRKALSASPTRNLRFVLNRFPQQRLIFREFPIIHQFSFTTGMTRHMPWQIVFTRESILTSIIWLENSQLYPGPGLLNPESVEKLTHWKRIDIFTLDSRPTSTTTRRTLSRSWVALPALLSCSSC